MTPRHADRAFIGTVVALMAWLIYASGPLPHAQVAARLRILAAIVSSGPNPIAAVRQPAGDATVPQPIWAAAGVVGGIPTYSVRSGSVIAAYSGSAATINTAIGNCGTNQYVELGAGVFTLSTGIEMSKSHCVLRGQGNSTILVMNGGVGVTCGWGLGRVVNLCTNNGTNSGPAPDHTATWSSGYAQGSTSIVISSTTSLAVGNTIWLDQVDDLLSGGYPAVGDVLICDAETDFLPSCDNNGTGESYARGSRGLLEAHLVTSIAAACGTSCAVGIDPPLLSPTFRASQSPGAWWANNGEELQYAGIENLTIEVSGSGGIYFMNATNCWIKGVRLIDPIADNCSGCYLIGSVNAHHVSVVNNYTYGPNTSQLVNVYQVALHEFANSLFQNNILHFGSAMFVSNAASWGNVVAYNYVEDGLGASFILHGIAGEDLFESNQAQNFSGDTIHGPHVLETLLRNNWEGATHAPRFGGLGGEANDCFDIYAQNRFFNLVGNVCSGTSWNDYQVTQTQSDNNKVYRLGWQGSSGNGIVANDANVLRTLFRWGNWDMDTSTTDTSTNNLDGIRWCGNASNTRWTQGATIQSGCASTSEVPSAIANYPNPIPSTETVPTSLYLSAKPSWYGSLTWPSNGPDVTSGNIANSGGHANAIPARVCFVAGTVSESRYSGTNPHVRAGVASDCAVP